MAALPVVPAKHDAFIQYLANHPQTPMAELVQPYRDFDARVRELYAQEPDHPTLKDPFINVLPLFDGNVEQVKIRARNLATESAEEKERFIMPLSDSDRKPGGSPAVVQSFKEFQNNFNVFSELSLADLDWSNVVAAGSSVVTSLLPVPEEYSESKRTIRRYYHEIVAPASDVDLFLYGLTEEEAIEKIKQIETKIRDSILTETTTIRTKNAITIASHYPTRHIQIVLRVYKSISEILTGFDVDCSCAAYDGKQVYVAPRALTAYMTQINQIDLTRRSPSYENRLSKYSHRGFEVYWPLLDRARVDPTIFERSFQRTVGLARLLVLEKLPRPSDRERYMDKRREERGRPAINRYVRRSYKLRGNIKDDFEDEVAEWVEEEEVSDYHTFTIPYGEKFHARKIEKLLYTKDLLLNAEWNKSKDREVSLHRHPAFFGYVEDVIEDCCGFCPKPSTPEEKEVAEKESKIYISGKISFIKDDPGRQTIGSFNPITNDDWTEMAYVGNTARFCQAIIDKDLEQVQDWLSQEGVDPNQRDYTGRTPLQLATMCSSAAIVKCLIDHGARIVARLADGRTALHIAAARGDIDMVKMILEKSEENEAEEEMKQMRKKNARESSQLEKHEQEKDEVKPADPDAGVETDDDSPEDDDVEILDDTDNDSDAEMRSATTGSYVRVDQSKNKSEGETMPDDQNDDEPDFYDVNVVAWDSKCSALHLAIINGHVAVVKELCSTFGADVLLPIKEVDEWSRLPKGAVLTLVLALRLPWEKAQEMVLTLLDLGASSAQADMKRTTAFHYAVKKGLKAIQLLYDNDKTAVQSAIKNFALNGNMHGSRMATPLTTALACQDTAAALKLLELGLRPEIDFETWFKTVKSAFDSSENHWASDVKRNEEIFKKTVEQPVILAARNELPQVVLKLLELGADPNTLTTLGQQVVEVPSTGAYHTGESLLDVIRQRIEQLDEYSAEELNVLPPLELEDDDFYLNGLQDGSYRHWVALISLEEAKKQYQRERVLYTDELHKQETRKGLQEKKDTIKQLIKGFKEAEADVVRSGGKTFKELHPDINCRSNQDRNQYNHRHFRRQPIKFEVCFNFSQGYLTPEKRAVYCRLFQAAWDGDLAMIKKLTLMPLSEDKSQPPLQIATHDDRGMSPFSIAVLRGHLNIAKAILEIARAQYEPEGEVKRERYSIVNHQELSDYSDDDGSVASDDNGIQVYREIVDDQFTIENIGEVSLKVQSRITPLQCLKWSADISSLAIKGKVSPKPDTSIEFDKIGRISLFAYAILVNDLKLFKFLLDLGEEYTHTGEDDATTSSHFFDFSVVDLEMAIEFGRTQHLAEIMKRTGCGIPLEQLVKKSGVEIKEKPKYYQGLYVHGRKRTDWAARGRNVIRANTTGSDFSPLLQAAKEGSIESVEWMLSDAPTRHYLAFAQANKHDKRLAALSMAGGGIEKAITTWFQARSKCSIFSSLRTTAYFSSGEYLLHCAIFAPSKDETICLVEYLVKAFPSAINMKSSTGLTPLSLAFSLGRGPLAKLLIDAGADQTIRDRNEGNNLLHSLLVANRARHNVSLISTLIDYLDIQHLENMFTQRNSYTHGAMTPLQYWLNRAVNTSFSGSCMCSNREADLESLLKLLLRYSKGIELEMVDGAGETALHLLVTRNKVSLMRILLDFNPMLLYRENATGRTPAEVAYDQYMAPKIAQEQDLTGFDRYNAFYQMSHFQKAPEKFVKDKEDLSPTAWDVCQEYMEKHPGKRRLVSLNEANEVARRLAETQKKNERKMSRRQAYEAEDVPDTAEDEKSTDVVYNWQGTATRGWNEDHICD